MTPFGATPTMTLKEFMPLYDEYVAFCLLINPGAATSMSVQSITMRQDPNCLKEDGAEILFFPRDGIDVMRSSNKILCKT